MITSASRNKRMAKNAIMLYLRMILIMLVTLYSSRVILDVLGVSDYGIYNIVAGIVVLFTFINNAMSTATQRFLNFELGRNDIIAANNYFRISFIAHISIAFIILLCAETIGLWFLYERIEIPPMRQAAALWVYHLSVLTTCVRVIRIPYNACIIAYEQMSFYAYVSIFEALFKLGIVYILFFSEYDNLIYYAVLLLFAEILIFCIYAFYCIRNFPVSHYSFFWDKSLYYKLLSFSSWTLLGSMANVAIKQGINIILNLFYGVLINAAVAIANQVSQAIYSFFANVQLAINPQIVKSYASGDNKFLMNLLFTTSKYGFFLLFMLSLPIFFYCDFILSIWLNEVPEYSDIFIKLSLAVLLLDAISAPLCISIQAIGNIRNYQIIISLIILLTLPLGYYCLYMGLPSSFVFIAHIFTNILALCFRLYYLYKKIQFPLLRYFREVVIRIFFVSIFAFSIIYMVSKLYASWSGLLLTGCASLLIMMILVYTIGSSSKERVFLNNIIKRKIFKVNRV